MSDTAEIERLRKLLSDTNTYYAECISERELIRAENDKLQTKCETIYDELLEAKGQVVKLRAALKLCVCRPNEIAAALKGDGDEN